MFPAIWYACCVNMFMGEHGDFISVPGSFCVYENIFMVTLHRNSRLIYQVDTGKNKYTTNKKGDPEVFTEQDCTE